MGFLQICAGVVLLQLSKSAKDVPDAAVFKGDLDQVRTVAEQEEPEYEPRADTIRGSAALLRSLSTAREKREAKEVERIKEERMEPIGENEAVEWDGLRRRKTIIGTGQPSPGLARRKTIHPPLGMSHFPDPNQLSDDDDDGEMHPGFFNRLRTRSKAHSRSSQRSAGGAMQMEGLTSPGGTRQTEPFPPLGDGADSEASSRRGTSAAHVYGLPPGLRREHASTDVDTEYKPHESTIHWSEEVIGPQHQAARSTPSLAPPRPPPHATRRQFSFQNVFHRRRESSGATDGKERPTTSRSHLSFISKRTSSDARERRNQADGTTEEERLGLVKGDSSIWHENNNERDASRSDSPDSTGRRRSSVDAGGATLQTIYTGQPTTYASGPQTAPLPSTYRPPLDTDDKSHERFFDNDSSPPHYIQEPAMLDEEQWQLPRRLGDGNYDVSPGSSTSSPQTGTAGNVGSAVAGAGVVAGAQGGTGIIRVPGHPGGVGGTMASAGGFSASGTRRKNTGDSSGSRDLEKRGGSDTGAFI
jgi:magnesium transporter